MKIKTSDFQTATTVPIKKINSATWINVQDALNLINSTGRATGGTVTDAGSETVNVAAGTGFIKATDDDTAELLSFDWAASNGLAITTDTTRYIGVEYGATPAVVVKTTDTFDLDTDFPLATVVNEGGSLHILCNPWWTTDGITNVIERFQSEGNIVRDNNIGGLLISVPGTRNIAVTAGTLWSRLNEFLVPAIDTFTAKVASHSAVFDVDNGSSKGTITASAGTPYTALNASDYIAITGTGDNDGTYKIDSVVGGNVITMTTVIAGTDGTEATTIINSTVEYYWYDAVAGTWEDEHITQYSVLLWNDFIDANPVTLANNKYANIWVYAEADDNEISLVYPQAEYVTSSQAEAESPPSSIPPHIAENGILIGRIIIKQATDAPIQIDSAFETTFNASQAADHGNLAGLGDDDHTQYILHSLSTAANDFLIGSGSNTYIKKTLAETGAILEGDIDHSNLQNLSTGAAHSYIDQDVTVTGTPEFGITTLADASTLKSSAAPSADAEIANKKYVDDQAGGASTALDNLASVAINESLVSDTYNTDALGTSAIGWSDLFLGTGSVIEWSSAASTSDITLTHSAEVLTFAGGTIALGTATATGGLTGNITGDVTGNAGTVTTITGLAPDTATTQATQPNITTAAGLPWTGLKPGTDGEIPTFDASGNPAFVAVGTDTHVLTSNGAGAAPTFQAASGGGVTVLEVQVFS